MKGRRGFGGVGARQANGPKYHNGPMATPTAEHENASTGAQAQGVGRPQPAGRLGYIEGMRGVAAFYVVLQHICTMVDPYRGLVRGDLQPHWLGWAMRPLWYGHLAVSAFIVISGFCLQLSLYGRGDGSLKDVRRFLLRRCERILPPYYACLAISLAVCFLVTRHQTGMPFSQYLPVTWANVAAHVFMVHNLDPAWMYKINGVLWSIAIEFQLYFAFPLLVAALARWRGWPVLLLAGLLAWGLLEAIPSAMKLYVWYAPLFVLGMFAARLAFDPHRPPLAAWHWGSLAWVGAAATVVSLRSSWPMPISDSLGGITTAALLAMGASSQKALSIRFFSLKPIVLLGAFSYSLYLMHHPVMQTVFVLRPEAASTPLRQTAYLAVVGLPVILVLCYAFYWVFERPFVKARRRA